MARRPNFFALFALVLSVLEISAAGGDQEQPAKEVVPAERKEFHLTINYPFVFRPASYLQTTGPAPMRYGPPAIDMSDRNPPPLPQSAKGVDEAKLNEEAKEKAAAQAALAAAQAQASPTPKDLNEEQRVVTAAYQAAYPVPQNAPTPVPKGSADFGKAPDEVDGYFRNQYNFVPDSHRFFDPIFDPAVPPVDSQAAQQGPKSTATYTQTP
jgi:hypothetical protein